MAPPNIFFLPNSKLFFAQTGKNTDPFLAIFFLPHQKFDRRYAPAKHHNLFSYYNYSLLPGWWLWVLGCLADRPGWLLERWPAPWLLLVSEWQPVLGTLERLPVWAWLWLELARELAYIVCNRCRHSCSSRSRLAWGTRLHLAWGQALPGWPLSVGGTVLTWGRAFFSCQEQIEACLNENERGGFKPTKKKIGFVFFNFCNFVWCCEFLYGRKESLAHIL